MAISGILNAVSLFEVASAVMLFTPLAFYFTVLMLPQKHHSAPVIEPIVDIIPNKLKKIKNTDYDPERRKFLKLIGAAGGSLFMLAMFTKKAEAAFFGSMPGPGTVAIKNTLGSQIDPAEKKPTDGYNITEIDDSGVDIYYGFVNKDGAWYIQKELSTGAYRYTKGTSDFTNILTGWPNKTALSYGYFNDVF
jgi:hypothetical protein